MIYKFQFTRQRYARRIKLGEKEFFNLDVNNGFFVTEDDKIGKELQRIAASKNENRDSEIIDLSEMAEKIEDIIKPSKNTIVRGARSSKDNEGDSK